MRKNFILSIFCILIVIGSSGAYSNRVQFDKEDENKMTVPTIMDGVFTAELSFVGNENSIYLNGTYEKNDNSIICEGITTIRGKECEFIGSFFIKEEGRLKKDIYFEITINVDEPINIKGKFGFDKNGQDFQGKWYLKSKDGNRFDKSRCFDFMYPISYLMPDGSILTIENKGDIVEIKNWYRVNLEVKEKPTLLYPVDIIWRDGTIQTINNEEEMMNAYKQCKGGERGIEGWIKGTFHGFSYDNKIDLGINFEKFPILSKFLDRPVFKKILKKI